MPSESRERGPDGPSTESIRARIHAFTRASCARANAQGRPILARAYFSVKSDNFEVLCAQIEDSGESFSLWFDQAKGRRWLAVGSELEISGSDLHALRPVFNELRTVLFEEQPSDAPLVFFGGAFAQGRDMSTEKDRLWFEWPEAMLRVPNWILSEGKGEKSGNLTVSLWVRPGDEAKGLDARIHGILEGIELGASVGNSAPGHVEEQPLESHEEWCARVSQTAERCQNGPLSKVVLARSVRLTCPLDTRFSIAGTIQALAEQNPGTTILAFKVGTRTMVAATPETLVHLENGRLETHALAGTIGRSDEPEKDAALGQTLLESPKDRAEHRVVTQAMVQGLQPLAQTLVVDHQPRLRKLASVQHLETRMVGQLHDDVDLLGVISTLHPTPALGGQPRGAALSWLEKTEHMDRGWYGGFLGWMNKGDEGTAHVAIRCALVDTHEAFAFTGAGIVAKSDPEMEWHETEMKLGTIRNALRVTEDHR